MQKCTITENLFNQKIFYGIKIENEDGSVYSYNYISVFRDDADNLCKQMSTDFIYPVHYNDIVTDYLTSLFYKKLKANNLN